MNKKDLKELLFFYILNRKFEQAIELGEKYVKDRPDPEILYIIGLAYEGLNERDKAIMKFREVLNIYPDMEEAYEHLKKLVSN